MQAPASASRDIEHAARTQKVIATMDDLRTRFGAPGGEFEFVRPARWRHRMTGHHVETGYSYGEGRVRVFLDGGRTADADFVISGREDDLDGLHELFPVSSA